MSSLDKETVKQKIRKSIITYIGLTVFCGIFSLVYEHFSHGVYSDYMVWLFLFPLVGGVLPFSVIGMMKNPRFPGRASFNMYNCGIATLATGSCLEGVLEIYGTTSGLLHIYWIVGISLSVAGIIIYLLSDVLGHDNKPDYTRESE